MYQRSDIFQASVNSRHCWSSKAVALQHKTVIGELPRVQQHPDEAVAYEIKLCEAVSRMGLMVDRDMFWDFLVRQTHE